MCLSVEEVQRVRCPLDWQVLARSNQRSIFSASPHLSFQCGDDWQVRVSREGRRGTAGMTDVVCHLVLLPIAAASLALCHSRVFTVESEEHIQSKVFQL